MGGRGWGWGGGSTWVSLELLLHVNRHLIFVCLLYNESLCNVSFVDFRVHRHRRAHGAGQVPSGLRPAISQLRSPAIFPNIFPLSSRRCRGGGGGGIFNTHRPYASRIHRSPSSSFLPVPVLFSGEPPQEGIFQQLLLGELSEFFWHLESIQPLGHLVPFLLLSRRVCICPTATPHLEVD